MWLSYVLVPGWSDQEECLHALGNHFKGYTTSKDKDTALQQAWYPQTGSIRYGIQAKKGFNLPPDKHLDKVAGIYRQHFKSELT